MSLGNSRMTDYDPYKVFGTLTTQDLTIREKNRQSYK